MIDLHFHVLPGIDDGPRTLEESLALARAAAKAGTRTIAATPHVSSSYRNNAEEITRLVSALNARLAEERVGVEIVTGAEIALSHIRQIKDGELARLGLGGGPWLLVEPPLTPTTANINGALLSLQRRHQLVLAHPERCPTFQREPKLLGSLARAGILLSVTAGSLIGRFGAPARRLALALVREQLVHNVASDAHNLATRRPGMAVELEQVGLGPLAEWLTYAVPEAILAGASIPPRPMHAIHLPRDDEPWWRRRLRRA